MAKAPAEVGWRKAKDEEKRVLSRKHLDNSMGGMTVHSTSRDLTPLVVRY
jgi:hypothetical protein